MIKPDDGKRVSGKGLRYLKWVATAGALAMVLAACGTSKPSSSASKLTFAYANVTDNSTLFDAIQSGFVEAAHTAGVGLTTYNNNLSGTTALNNARLMAQSKPDLAFEYNVVAGLGHTLAETFVRAGVRCIAVNVPAPPCALMNLNNPLLGTDTAKVVAPLLKARGWTGADTTVIIEQNATAGTDVNSSVRDFYSMLAQLVPGMTKIAGTAISASTTTIGTTGIQVDTGGTLDGAYAAVQQVLSGLSASRHLVLYANNDDEALGGWRAVVAAGRSTNALVAGLGGSSTALEQLRTNPHWVAEGILPAQGWGEVGIAMAVAMVHGAKPPATTYIPQAVVTKGNIQKYYGSSNTTPRLLTALPSVDKYLLATGVLQKFHNIEGVK